MSGAGRLRPPSLESLFVATFGLLGLRLGLRPLGDNSLFVHLRTGIDIVRTGRIPRTDPYSFTADGDPWVVQSWLASAAYGLAHRLGGFPLVRIGQGVVYALLALVLARLARTGSPIRTALAGVLVVATGVVYWAPRPLAFGLLAMALTITVVERRRAWWLLVPLVWVWANSHGSFVLGLAWLVLVAIAQRLAGERRPSVLPWLGGFLLGLVAAAVNPLGPRLLTFPVAVAQKREAFAQVAEWRPPAFLSTPAWITLVALAGIAGVLARRRPPWTDLLPLAAFVAAGLVAQRNLPMAAVVAAPVVGRALRRDDPPVEEPARPGIHVVIAGVLGALASLFIVVSAREPALDLAGYPVRAAQLYDRPARVVTTDVGAGYLILRDGRRAGVLIDDRVDLYPLRLTKDYLRLLRGAPDALAILDRYDADVVVWERKRALDAQLAASGRWRRVGTRDGWGVWVRSEG